VRLEIAGGNDLTQKEGLTVKTEVNVGHEENFFSNGCLRKVRGQKIRWCFDALHGGGGGGARGRRKGEEENMSEQRSRKTG